MFELHTGDCRDVMRTMEPDSIDSIVTDPPYGLSFMGKGWDHGVPGTEFWVEALRVAKPGAYLLAFGGTRTFHRLTVAIEDAGWEIRDCVMWVYGSGFPKSHDVSKAIDKAAGAERKFVSEGEYSSKAGSGRKPYYAFNVTVKDTKEGRRITAPATGAAQQWSGWGTALKPAWEPVIVARKPLVGTVPENVLRYGTGGINIDGCRVGTESTGWNGLTADRSGSAWDASGPKQADGIQRQSVGRWPANVIHDGSDEVVGLFPQTASKRSRFQVKGRSGGILGKEGADRDYIGGFDDSGSAARFFYSPKANKTDRDEGCEHIEEKVGFDKNTSKTIAHINHETGVTTYTEYTQSKRRNHHPTVKPTTLMRYLCRLVTPPNGLILDPFMGSGSTGKAAILEGYRFKGIDITPEYASIAEARIKHAAKEKANERTAN